MTPSRMSSCLHTVHVEQLLLGTVSPAADGFVVVFTCDELTVGHLRTMLKPVSDQKT